MWVNPMNTKASITKAYDLAADDYAANWWNEFEKKHFDRLILDWFAAQIPKNEVALEIGAGPGEVSGYLANRGVKCLGTDISSQMIENARNYFPDIQFEVQDFFNLTYGNESFFSVIAYYAIVNLSLDEIRSVFKETRRVLKDNGLFLFTFHIFENEAETDVENFFNKEGNRLTFYYFKVDEMKSLVESSGFQIIDILIRYPYPNVEFGSKRAYFILRKVKNEV